jgi:hypothetical protein
MNRTSDFFEGCLYCKEAYPDDSSRWPENQRGYMDAAVNRLLVRYPDAKVIEDRTYCWSKDHPRFPESNEVMDRLGLNFVLVRQIKFDRSVPL